MATLATTYTNARNKVPGANTTNMPDSVLLVEANSIYLWLFQKESPRIHKYSGGTFGWATAASGDHLIYSTGTNFARILNVRYEGTEPATTDGPPLHYLTLDQYELERQAFPAAAAVNGTPRCAHWYRDDATQRWALLFFPYASGIIYFSFEGEIEPQALSSGASTLLISPASIALLDNLLALKIAALLGASDAVVGELQSRVPDQKALSEWIAREDSRGESLKGEARGRR